MQVQAYLNFDGRCEEALEFYRKALGAEIEMMMRFKDAPADGPEPPEGCGEMPAGSESKVMHASFRVGETMLMASDCMSQGQPSFEGISLSISAANVAEAERLFAALGEGGQVQMPLTETFFSPRFGTLTDRFGVSWMIVVGT